MLPLPARRSVLALLTIAAVAGCSDDEITDPTDPVEGTLTVDAADGWAFADLESGEAVTVADPASSSAWDIGFNAVSIMLNGGAAGPGGVSGYCICANAGATDEQVLAMTAESELADFESVTAADIDGAAFETEELVPAITQWYTGTGAAAVATGQTYLLRLHDGTSFAKMRVVSIAGADASSAGNVTVEYAVQPSAAEGFGTTETVVLDAAAGTTLDLVSGTTDGAEWDIALDGFTFTVNGGVSGTGDVGSAFSEESFEAVTTAAVDARAYLTDRFGGVFTSEPWYRYNLTGEHIVHPTFDVYLIERGDDVYKLQVLDYYGPAGEPRQITFRYAKLTD